MKAKFYTFVLKAFFVLGSLIVLFGISAAVFLALAAK